MKNVIALLFFVFILQLNMFADDNIDSLFIHIETLSEKKQADTLKKIIVKNIFRDPKTTFVYVNKFKTLPEVGRDSMLLCLSNYWMGMIYEIFGDYQKAIDYDFKSLEIAEKINNRKLIAITLNNIGLVYSYQDVYHEKALEYFRKYLKISKLTNNNNDVMGAYLNIGMLYQRMREHDSSGYYYELAYELATTLDDKRNKALAFSVLGTNEKEKGNDKLFFDYSRKALQIFKDEGYLIDLAALYYDMSIWFKENNQTDSALLYSINMLDIATEYDLTTYEQKALLNISEVYSNNGDYQKAYENLNNYLMLKDSTDYHETKEKLAQLQTIYEVEIKDKEIENLKITERLQNRKEMFYLLLIVVVIFVSLIIIYSIIIKRRKDKLVSRQKFIIHEKEKELAELALEKSKANEKELETKLAFKTRQLTTHAVSMMQKNKLMHELSESMVKVSKYVNDDQKNEIRKLQQQIKRSLNVEKDWELFKMYFEQVNKDFFTNLLSKVPSLSSNDLRLSALIKLNMNIKEAASVFNVEPASVKSARYRLRKKLGLEQEDDLYEYMSKV
ncbi:MAG: tetratricopeptide repeat protein [Bacteroidota bacterium]